MFCSNCGNKINEESKYCQKCGEEVNKNQSVEKSPTKVIIESNKKTLRILGTVVIVLISLMIFCILSTEIVAFSNADRIKISQRRIYYFSLARFLLTVNILTFTIIYLNKLKESKLITLTLLVISIYYALFAKIVDFIYYLPLKLFNPPGEGYLNSILSYLLIIGVIILVIDAFINHSNKDKKGKRKEIILSVVFIFISLLILLIYFAAPKLSFIDYDEIILKFNPPPTATLTPTQTPMPTENLSFTPEPIWDEIIVGAWFDDGSIPMIYVIKKSDSTYIFERTSVNDQSHDVNILLVEEENNILKLILFNNDPSGEYMTITENNYLQFNDNQGMIFSLPPLDLNELCTEYPAVCEY